MDGVILVLLLAGSLALIVLVARRAAGDAPPQPPRADDPHAGTLREVAGQAGPRIYDLD